MYLLLLLTIPFSFTSQTRRLLQSLDLCPSENITFSIHLIDASPNVRIMGCEYSISILAGSCSYTSEYVRETEAGYVCFNQTSTPCGTVSLPFSITGNYRCRGNLITEPINLPLGNYEPLKEYTVETDYIKVNAFIGLNCYGVPIQYPRECTKVYMATNSGERMIPNLLALILILVTIL